MISVWIVVVSSTIGAGSGVTGLGVGFGEIFVDVEVSSGVVIAAGSVGGVVSAVDNSGTLIGSNGAIGSGAGVTIPSFGSGNGPIGSPSSPVSPSGIEDGAATGSEKIGSTLVSLVMLSIAFCKSLSTV